MTKKTKVLITLISIVFILFLSLLITMIINDFKPLGIDKNIASIAYNIRGEKFGGIYWVSRILTELGFVYVLICITIIIGSIYKYKLPTLFFPTTLLINFLLNTIIKLFCNRVRPDEALRWMRETSSSFPSGHSASSMCCYVLLIYFVIKFVTNKKVRNTLVVLFGLIILIVGTTRIILGVHYFTDVLGGFLIGGFTSLIAILIMEILHDKDIHYFIKRKKEQIN